MEKQVEIGNPYEYENETAQQVLVRSVKDTEKKLLKANKLTRIMVGSAIVMTTCPEKYNTLKR